MFVGVVCCRFVVLLSGLGVRVCLRFSGVGVCCVVVGFRCVGLFVVFGCPGLLCVGVGCVGFGVSMCVSLPVVLCEEFML